MAEKVNVEVSAVETQTVEKEVPAETNSQSTVSSSKGHGSSSIKNGNSSTTKSTVNNSKSTSVSNSSNATSSDKTEVTETVNSETLQQIIRQQKLRRMIMQIFHLKVKRALNNVSKELQSAKALMQLQYLETAFQMLKL